MASLKVNTIANILGQSWSAAVGFILLPFYISYLGIDGYGIIGYFLSLQALVAILDLGLSATANREVAAKYGNKEAANDLWVTFYTLLTVYIIIAICLGVLLWSLSDFITNSWLKSNKYTSHEIVNAIHIYTLIVSFRWPTSLFLGFLRGMEKQVQINIIVASIATLRMVGVLIVLTVFNASLDAVLLVQLLGALVELFLLWRATVRNLPEQFHKNWAFDAATVHRVWKFSVGVGTISIMAAGIKQFDKMLISVLLPLEQVGHYMLASQTVSIISYIVNPLITAVYPRLTSHFFSCNQHGLSKVYRTASSAVTFSSAPISMLMAFFSFDLLSIWTGSSGVASQSSLPLTLLALAALFNAPMQVSYVLQLATGNLIIPLATTAITLIVSLPTMYFGVSKYGIAGGAAVWLVYNVLYFIIIPHVTHQYVLKADKWQWIIKDTTLFIVTAAIAIGMTSLLFIDSDRKPFDILLFCLIFTLLYLCFLFFIDGRVRELATAMFKQSCGR